MDVEEAAEVLNTVASIGLMSPGALIAPPQKKSHLFKMKNFAIFSLLQKIEFISMTQISNDPFYHFTKKCYLSFHLSIYNGGLTVGSIPKPKQLFVDSRYG